LYLSCDPTAYFSPQRSASRRQKKTAPPIKPSDGSDAIRDDPAASAGTAPNQLFRQTAVCDNTAMESEPPKIIPPTRKRHWFQFSLRSLLIFVIATAVFCGWAGKRIEQKRKEREAAETLVKFGGSVMYDYEKGTNSTPPGPDWLRKLFGENLFSEVSAVYFIRESVSDRGLTNLEALTRLQILSLYGCNFTDDGLAHIKGLTQLKHLSLAETNVTDAGLEHIERLTQLRKLLLADSNISDAGVEHLKGLAQLQELDLTGTDVTDAGLENLKRLTNLQSLGLDGANVTDAGVAGLQRALPNCQISYIHANAPSRPDRIKTASGREK
jgi:Leucine Rich repeat